MAVTGGLLAQLLCLASTSIGAPLRDSPGNWQPMKGSRSATLERIAGVTAVRMDCNFEGTTINRASWDRNVRIDMSSCRGLQFKFYCADTSPVAGFNVYFHSADGWYAAKIDPNSAADWVDVFVDKAGTSLQGNPGGWQHIDRLRISAWRGHDVNTAFYIDSMVPVGQEAPIVLLRAESVARSRTSEASAVVKYGSAAARHLESLGLDYCTISDLDLTKRILRKRKIVILPHNPELPPRAAAALRDYIGGGGKIICFYVLPPEIAPLVGIRPVKHRPQKSPGEFSSIRAIGTSLRGMPSVVRQTSWNIYSARPVRGRSVALANWHDGAGASTGEAALIGSDNCILFTHVLLPDDPENKRRMLMSMVGSFMPEVWAASATKSLDEIQRFVPYSSKGNAEAAIARKARTGTSARSLLSEGRQFSDRARIAFASKNHVAAIAAAEAARDKFIRAHCAVQSPVDDEHRAFWCHSAFGIDGLSWDEAIEQLSNHGFTAIMPNMLWAGTAYYNSKVLPVAPAVADRGDQLQRCIDACKKHSIECHVWKVCWNMGNRAVGDFASRMKKTGRTQVTSSGKSLDQWLCPSHPANRELEINAMVELVRRYDVDGVHFDYIRYPSQDACFCDNCRSQFERKSRVKFKNWPADLLKSDVLQAKWFDFRRRNITTVVAEVSRQVRKIRPKVRISAAVFGNWPVDRRTIAQDWKPWCDAGYLDFVCPMDYTASTSRFRDLVSAQIGWVGAGKCYPGIGLSNWRSRDDICLLIEQISAARSLGVSGFTVFDYKSREANEILPLCSAGITRPVK